MSFEKKMYRIDFSKIKTIKDIKVILKKMNLGYTPTSEQDFEDMKKYLQVEEPIEVENGIPKN